MTHLDTSKLPIFVGVLLVVYDGNLAEFSLSRFGEPGVVLVLISAVNWTVVSVLSRRGLRSHPASLMILYLMAFGWLVAVVVAFFILGEAVTPASLLGGGIIILGVWLVNR